MLIPPGHSARGISPSQISLKEAAALSEDGYERDDEDDDEDRSDDDGNRVEILLSSTSTSPQSTVTQLTVTQLTGRLNYIYI